MKNARPKDSAPGPVRHNYFAAEESQKVNERSKTDGVPSVRISQDAAREIAKHYRQRRLHVLPIRTPPIGILLGHLPSAVSESTSIEQLVPVAWRPVLPSGRSVSSPEQLVHDFGSDQNQTPAIGLYALSDEFDSELLKSDLQVFSRCFDHPASVFALFAQDEEEIVASVFTRGSGAAKMNSETFTLHVDVDDFGGTQQSLRLTSQATDISSKEAGVPAGDDQPQRADVLQLPAHRIWAALVLFLVVAGTLWYAAGSRSSSVSTHKGRPIGIHVERTGQDLQITWDNNSPSISAATLAVLHITDGDYERDVTLSPDELKHGTLLYTPTSGELQVDMRVTTRDNSVIEESARVVDGNGPLALNATRNRKTDRKSSASTGKPATRVTAANTPKPSATVERPRSATSAMPSDDAARDDLSSSRPPAGSSSPNSAVAPVGRSSQSDGPAVLLHRSAIVLPDELRKHTLGKPSIDLRVSIDATGAVTDVRTLSSGRRNRQLAAVAAQSVRSWVFSPARRNGVPVAAEYTVRVRFGK